MPRERIDEDTPEVLALQDFADPCEIRLCGDSRTRLEPLKALFSRIVEFTDADLEARGSFRETERCDLRQRLLHHCRAEKRLRRSKSFAVRLELIRAR